MAVHIAVQRDADGSPSFIQLTQTLTLVLDVGSRLLVAPAAAAEAGVLAGAYELSLPVIMQANMGAACDLASISRIYLPPLQPSPSSVSKSAPADSLPWRLSGTFSAADGNSHGSKVSRFKFDVYDVSQMLRGDVPGSMGAARMTLLTPKAGTAGVTQAMRTAAGPLAVESYLTGSGTLRGRLVMVITLHPTLREVHNAAYTSGETSQQQRSAAGALCIFQVVPWYVRLYMHTLTLTINGQVSSSFSFTCGGHGYSTEVEVITVASCSPM